MFKINLDIKTIFIILLGLVIVFMILFRPKPNTEYYQNQIDTLREKNKNLLHKSDSLKQLNFKLSNEINSLNKKVDSINVYLEDNQKEIKRLKKRKNEIFNYVNTMDANSVTNGFSDYIKGRD